MKLVTKLFVTFQSILKANICLLCLFLAIILKEVTMKSKNNAFKKFLSFTAILILAILASLSMFSFKLQTAYSASISVDNSNFSDGMTENSSTPATPNSYTFVDSNFKSVTYNPQSTSSSQPKITAGVVNIEEQGYSKQSSNQDDYALMISSKKCDSSYTVKYGYTSTQFTLEADSFYKVAVDIFADETSNIASLYLVDENNKAYASFEHIGKSNNWSTYMFLIKTDDLTSIKLKLALFLDGNGTVLFDSVRVNELTEQQLESQRTTYSTTSTYVAPAQDNTISKTAFTKSNLNSVFANTSASREIVDDNDGYFTTAVKITNSASSYSQYQTADDFFTFEPNRVYRVTLNAKATDLSGKITLRLVQTGLEKDSDGNDVYDTDNNHTLTISANTSSTLTNNYKKYSFFVNSHPLKTTTFKLVVSVGSEDSTASGSVYLSGAILTSTTYSNFDSVSTGDAAQKINLASKIVDLDSDTSALLLTNGNFNSVKTTDYAKTYPVAPASWTVTTGENSQLYGVVNTDTTEFNKFSSNNTFTSTAVNPGNPNGLTESNNVLMMYNSTTDTLAYKSELNKSLSTKTYHRFSLNVQTQHSTINVYLVANVSGKEVVLSSIKNIATDGEWQNVDLYVHTGMHQLSVGIKVEMKSNGFGFAYIDDATFDFALRAGGVILSQPTESQFNEISSINYGSTHISKADLSNILTGESTDRYAVPVLFNTNTNENVDFGVIDLTNETDVNWVLNNPEQNFENFTSLENKNILAIHAKNYVNETYTSTIGYRFESGKYYLISVKIYTQNLTSESEKFGLNLSLTNFDGKFSNLNTETENGNGWKTYNFYVNPTEETTSMLAISFGSEDVALKGDAFIGDVTVKEIESNEFITTSNDTNLVLVTKTEEDDENNTDNETTDNNNSNSTAWFIAIPTILTAAAIIIAIVGFSLRKIKFKKPVKKAKSAYDRNSKQSQQIYMRKATALREERLHELNKKLETLQNERSQYEEKYKQDLSTLRQLKIKRAPANEIAKLEKDLKANQRHSAQIGSNIRITELEIEQTNSNEYLKQVVKKLASAKQDEE